MKGWLLYSMMKGWSDIILSYENVSLLYYSKRSKLAVSVCVCVRERERERERTRIETDGGLLYWSHSEPHSTSSASLSRNTTPPSQVARKMAPALTWLFFRQTDCSFCLWVPVHIKFHNAYAFLPFLPRDMLPLSFCLHRGTSCLAIYMTGVSI